MDTVAVVFATNMPKDVMVFQKACGQLEIPENEAPLYWDLIKEEFHELNNAACRIDELDAFFDLIWVILGYCHSKGYKVEEAWSKIVRSNMDKVDPETGKVRRRADGKIMKPDNWVGPDLTDCI